MPIYEYRCDACDAKSNELQKLSDPPLVDCPKCGKPALVRLVSAAGFQLKGTGWYQTDFKTKKKDSGGDAKTGDVAKADAPAQSDAPTKSDAPAAAAPTAAAPAAATPVASKPD